MDSGYASWCEPSTSKISYREPSKTRIWRIPSGVATVNQVTPMTRESAAIRLDLIIMVTIIFVYENVLYLRENLLTSRIHFRFSGGFQGFTRHEIELTFLRHRQICGHSLYSQMDGGSPQSVVAKTQPVSSPVLSQICNVR